MPSRVISRQSELEAFCGEIAGRSKIAFDTEFVSEDTYRPQLCLMQIAVGGRLTAIDALAIDDLTPIWRLLTDGEQETIVHAGREEISFCLDAIGAVPKRLVDVQLAAGLVGLEYPAGYSALVHRLLGKSLHKRETRTDWRRRPLSPHQVEYALDDIRDLEAVRDKLFERLESKGRLEWLVAETGAWLDELRSWQQRDRWRRVSGSGNLSRRDLALVREIWQWREEEAQRRNCPVRRILRDDLIVELAKRRSADPKQIAAVRGLDRGDLRRLLPSLAIAIQRGLNVSDDKCPTIQRRDANPHLSTMAQFLSSALTSICRTAEVAPSIVGTVQDVRDFIAYELGENPDRSEPPVLARGWRAEVVGNLLHELLRGEVSIRIRDPQSDEPLTFERRGCAGEASPRHG